MLIKQVHNESDCKYLIQLSHGGRQRDVPGIEFGKGLSSTDRADPLHAPPHLHPQIGGLGRKLVDEEEPLGGGRAGVAGNRDSVVIVRPGAIVVANIAVDLVYAFVDPRIRLG